MSEIIPGKSLSNRVNFHFEYALLPKMYELEERKYIGIGVSAKMIDENCNVVTEYIENVTSDTQAAEKLVHLLNLSKVSPMCLKIFIENFLANN